MAALCCEDVIKLYRCENKEKRRELLVKVLDYPAFDEEEDPRVAIILDFYVESFNFASEQGFSWQQGLALFQLMQDLRENTLGLSLMQATEHFKTKLNDFVHIFQHRTTSVVDFVFSLFFNHFNLYKFVFTNEKEVDTTCYHLNVQSPPKSIITLAEGIEKGEWDEQQALKHLESEHSENIMKKQLHYNLSIQNLETLIQEKLALLENQPSLDTNELKSIIEETVKVFVASTMNTITFSIEESQENLEYEFSKAGVTRRCSSEVLIPKKRLPTKGKGGKV